MQKVTIETKPRKTQAQSVQHLMELSGGKRPNERFLSHLGATLWYMTNDRTVWMFPDDSLLVLINR